MCALDKGVGDSDEVLEEWKHLRVITRGGQSHGQEDSLLRDSLFDPVKNLVSISISSPWRFLTSMADRLAGQ